MDISFIVPVYNTSKYLVQCLDSIVAQTDINKEIIIVNDGSTDNSLEIILDYVQRYEYISLVNQVNQGLSAARNAGIKQAVGEYLWFVDSDDYLYSCDVACKLYQQGKKEDLDMVFGRFIRGTLDGGTAIEREKFYRIENLCGKVMLARDFLKETVTNGSFYPTVWRGVYRRDYILKHDLYFIVGRIHEDEPHTIKALTISSTARLMQVGDIAYVYRINPSSIVNTVILNSIYKSAKSNFENYIWAAAYTKNNFIKNDLRKIIYKSMYSWLRSSVEKGKMISKEEKTGFNRYIIAQLQELLKNKDVTFYNKIKIYKIVFNILIGRY